MATAALNTEFFCKVTSTNAYVDNDFPNNKELLMQLYGEVDANAQMVFLSGDRVGIKTDIPDKVVDGENYINLYAFVQYRTNSSLFNWGKGEYKEWRMTVWVAEKNLTKDKTEAAKLLNERINAKKLAEQKKLDDILNSGEKPEVDTLGNTGLKNKTTVGLIISFLALLVGGLFFWNKKRKKRMAIMFQQSQNNTQTFQQPQQIKFKTTRL